MFDISAITTPTKYDDVIFFGYLAISTVLSFLYTPYINNVAFSIINHWVDCVVSPDNTYIRRAILLDPFLLF